MRLPTKDTVTLVGATQIIAHPTNFVAPILAAIVTLLGLVPLYRAKSNAYFRR